MNIRRASCFLLAFALITPIVRADEWQMDYERALAAAKSAKKCVLLNFTGSDWCGPCIQMHRTVFSKPAFLNYAKENLILVELDYPRRKLLPEKVTKQNERLSQQYNIDQSGYPTVVLLDPSGKILGQLEGYSGEGPADIIAWVEQLRHKKS
jgi:thioredoxin-related protein